MLFFLHKQTSYFLLINKIGSSHLKNAICGVATEAFIEFQKPFKVHKLTDSLPSHALLTRDDGLKLYRTMQILRKLENSANSLYKERIIRGFCHLYAGQEAVAAGIHWYMNSVDTLITAYRSHGWSYMMGVSVHDILAELCGKITGCCRGKGGSMHTYGINFYGGNGIVGSPGPLGAGIAFSHKYKENGAVSLTLYGDGAANQGQIHEAFNMAKLWNLPCFFICENNHYGMGTSTERASASTAFYTRGDYIPGIWGDGMDVLAMRELGKFGLEYCRSGKGPLVAEVETYRYFGHSMSDPGTSYRTKEEVQEIRHTQDPITSLKNNLLNYNLATSDELKAIENKVRKEIDAVVKEIRSEADTGPEELLHNVYSSYNSKIRRITPFL